MAQENKNSRHKNEQNRITPGLPGRVSPFGWGGGLPVILFANYLCLELKPIEIVTANEKDRLQKRTFLCDSTYRQENHKGFFDH